MDQKDYQMPRALMRKVDCIRLHVRNLDEGLAFYREQMGHELIWRTDESVGLRMPDTDAEIVLHTEQKELEIDLLVESADAAAIRIEKAGGRVVVPPFDIQIGQCVVVEDPWGNELVLLDATKGLLVTDDAGHVIGLAGSGRMLPEKAKTLVREYFHRLLNDRDLSVCDEMLSDNYVDHDAPADTPPGPESIKEYVAAFLRDYPDLRVRIKDIIAEGNQVAVRNTWQGTHRESGERLSKMGIVMLRFNDVGQIVERWSAYSLMQ